MTPTDILILAQTAGLTLMPAPGGNLRAGPPDALTPELRIALREHKAGLLALLCCSVFGCYQPGNVVELGGGFMARLCSAHRRAVPPRTRDRAQRRLTMAGPALLSGVRDVHSGWFRLPTLFSLASCPVLAAARCSSAPREWRTSMIDFRVPTSSPKSALAHGGPQKMTSSI